MSQLEEYGRHHRHFEEMLPLMDYTQLNSNGNHHNKHYYGFF